MGGQEIDLKLGHRYKEIRDTLVVGSYRLITFYNFQSSRSFRYSGSEAVSKLQKGDVKSGHSNWPGDLTFQSHAKFRAAARRGFSVMYENPRGGGGYPLPVGARVKVGSSAIVWPIDQEAFLMMVVCVLWRLVDKGHLASLTSSDIWTVKK